MELAYDYFDNADLKKCCPVKYYLNFMNQK